MKKEHGSTLSPEESSDFFRLFIPLLQAVNRAYGITADLEKQLRSGHPNMGMLREIAQALWEDTNVLDEYMAAVAEQEGLPDEDRRILEGWKHPVSATFILERHLAKGSIFIDPETEKVYLVKGLTQTWEELMPGWKPPILLDATLIPYCGKIVSDGLVAPHRASFGSGYREAYKRLYMEAKQAGSILTTLESI